MKKIANRSLLVIPILLSCTIWSAKDWDSLQDRKFCFHTFTFIHKGDDRNGAYAFMKRFPLKKILIALSRRYALTIDMSEFNRFTSSDDPSPIEVSGFLMNEEFTWTGAGDTANQIAFEYIIHTLEESSCEFKLIVKNRNRVRAMYHDYAMTERSAVELLTNKLLKGSSSDYGLIIEHSDTEGARGPHSGHASAEKIKNEISSHVRTMTPEEKKKFRDDMIKFIEHLCK